MRKRKQIKKIAVIISVSCLSGCSGSIFEVAHRQTVSELSYPELRIEAKKAQNYCISQGIPSSEMNLCIQQTLRNRDNQIITARSKWKNITTGLSQTGPQLQKQQNCEARSMIIGQPNGGYFIECN